MVPELVVEPSEWVVIVHRRVYAVIRCVVITGDEYWRVVTGEEDRSRAGSATESKCNKHAMRLLSISQFGELQMSKTKSAVTLMLAGVLVLSGGSWASAESDPEQVSPELASLMEYVTTAPAEELDAIPSSGSFTLSGADVSEGVEQGWITSSDPAVLDAAARAGIGCTHTVDRRHYSAGANGVISKVRVKCQLVGATSPASISVRMVGTITFTTDPDTIKSVVVASDDYSQDVPTNNAQTTFYLPRPNEDAGTAAGFYRACAQITPSGGTALATVCNSVTYGG